MLLASLVIMHAQKILLTVATKAWISSVSRRKYTGGIDIRYFQVSDVTIWIRHTLVEIQGSIILSSGYAAVAVVRIGGRRAVDASCPWLSPAESGKKAKHVGACPFFDVKALVCCQIQGGDSCSMWIPLGGVLVCLHHDSWCVFWWRNHWTSLSNTFMPALLNFYDFFAVIISTTHYNHGAGGSTKYAII